MGKKTLILYSIVIALLFTGFIGASFDATEAGAGPLRNWIARGVERRQSRRHARMAAYGSYRSGGSAGSYSGYSSYSGAGSSGSYSGSGSAGSTGYTYSRPVSYSRSYSYGGCPNCGTLSR